jgi:hypothetical protein
MHVQWRTAAASAVLTSIAIVTVALVSVALPRCAIATTEQPPAASGTTQLRPIEAPVLYACEDSPQALSIAVLMAGSAAAAVMAVTLYCPTASRSRGDLAGRRSQ